MSEAGLQQGTNETPMASDLQLIIGILGEEVEDTRHAVCKKIHEHGDPEHPREIPRPLRNDVGRALADKRPDLANAQFQPERRRKAVIGREPRREDLVLRDLRGDVAEGLDHPPDDHELV